MVRISLLVLFLLFSFVKPPSVFSEEEKAALSTENIKQAVEKAIKDVEAEKVEKQKAETTELKASLDSITKDQIIILKKNKAGELNKLIHQNWEALDKFTSPVPYDYYLRDFSYIVAKSDIFKTDSLISPYRAAVEILEKQYVERYHSPSAVDVKEYRDTISIPIRMSLEYRDGRFNIISSEYGEISIERGWRSR